MQARCGPDFCDLSQGVADEGGLWEPLNSWSVGRLRCLLRGQSCGTKTTTDSVKTKLLGRTLEPGNWLLI